ncbi:MAG TPA: acyltransferase [Nevskia sp.]|nr:acyltransferase [Nevskia sp.]
MEPVARGSEAQLQRAPRPRPRAWPPRPAPGREAQRAGVARLPQPEAAQRIDALDGLRAVSILVVLLGHASRGNDAPAWLWPVRDLGILGVYLFFAISGFIITWLMLRERQRRGTISLAAFWERRAWRILPPFAAACAGIGLLAALGLMRWHWQSFLGALTFTKNTTLFQGDWFFGHFWSLSMEEQFYLAWPLLILPLLRSGRARAILLAVCLTSPLLALFSLEVIPPKLDNTLPCVPYLAAGCLLAVSLHGRRRPLTRLPARRAARRAALLLVPALALAAAAFKRDAMGSVLATLLTATLQPLAAFILVAEAVTEDGLLRRPLSFAPLRWLGLASYSIYLWQQPFLAPPDTYRSAWWVTHWPQNFFVAIACGALAYLLVEKPAAALKRRMAGAAGAARPAASGAPG